MYLITTYYLAVKLNQAIMVFVGVPKIIWNGSDNIFIRADILIMWRQSS